MRKAIPFLLVFALGLWVGFALVRSYSVWQRTPAEQARKAVLAILDKAPPSAGNPDNPFIEAAARIEPAVVNIDTAGSKQEVFETEYGKPIAHNFNFEGKG